MRTNPSPLLLVAVFAVSCASLKTADGTLNIPELLRYADYGIAADCALGSSTLAADICTFGTDGIATARAAYDRNPATGAAAVKQTLVDLEARHPKVKPYTHWLVELLP